jgi:hypothetical protein
MWLYATSRSHLMIDGMTPALSRFVAKLHTAPILLYCAAIALAYWYVPLGLLLFAAVPAFFILPNPFIDRRLRAAVEATSRVATSAGHSSAQQDQHARSSDKVEG